MSPVCVILHRSSVDFPFRYLKPVARNLLSHEAPQGAQVNVILSDNRLLRRLNKRFRKKDRPTDVLSFSFNEPLFLGEVYISLDKAKKQAREYGATLKEEVVRLMIHGLLHLLGYTHYRTKERMRMEGMEQKYLTL
jgi:probable rRNA maturation factor